MKKISKITLACALLAMTVSGISGVHAQGANYPERPIKLLVGFSAGSTNDAVARIVGEALSRAMGQPAVVENKTGANGSLAVQTVAQAKPDGYTLLVSNTSSITVNPLIYDDLRYEPERDFDPVTTVVSFPLVLVTSTANEKLKDVKSATDLVKFAKTQKEPITYGSAGVGNLLHIAGAEFVHAAGIEATHVPYRGGAPMQVALLGGQIDFAFHTLAVVPHVKEGTLRALAVTERERWRDLPDAPTMEEAGFPSVYMSPWMGVLAPKGTPPEVLAKLRKAMDLLSTDATLRKQLEMHGRVDLKSPEAFSKQIHEELAVNKKTVAREGILIKP